MDPPAGAVTAQPDELCDLLGRLCLEQPDEEAIGQAEQSEQRGGAGLHDAPRSGAPSRYTTESKARVVAAARTRPSELGLL